MIQIPTVDDVARVAAMTDLAARNREVTDGYYRFSQRFRQYLGEDVAWPTLATWASAQAGRTVRKEDLLRALERRLGDSPAIRRLVEGPFRLTAKFVLQSILRLNPFERSCQAVSRGNIKVYEEIGAEFARFLPLLEKRAGEAEMELFLAGLLDGPPPEGQEYLRKAFRAYLAAMALPPGKARCELVLLGNICIGFHEQTRLQPEIEASIDGSVWDGIEIKDRLFDLLLPRLAFLRKGLSRLLLKAKLDPWLAPVVVEVQQAVREILTETLMVLELPGEVLRLGQDLSGEFPEWLQTIELVEAQFILSSLDPSPDSLKESAARNWADFGERMHFIVDLFRARQRTARLFERPEDLGTGFQGSQTESTRQQTV